MASCTYKIGDKEFKTLKDLRRHIIAAQLNETVPELTSQEDVVKMIKSVGDKIRFDGRREIVEGQEIEHHEYYFGTKELTPVSNLIEKEYKFTGTSTERGESSRDHGTRFHNIAEEVINGLNDKKDIKVLHKIGKNDVEKKWVDHVVKLYEGWSDGGKNVVLSEFMIGNIKEGVAGTVDVAVVKPDGTVELYDFKGTGSKYLGEEGNDASIKKSKSKRRSNNLQLNFYQRMLEVGDKELGLKKVKVTGGGLIPIEFDISSDNKTLNGFTPLDPLDYQDPEIYETQNTNRSIAKSRFPVDSTDLVISNIKSSQMTGYQDFMSHHLGIDFSTTTFESGARRIVASSKPNKDGIYEWSLGRGTQKITFKNPVAAKDSGPEGREARYQEIINNQEYKAKLSAVYTAPAVEFKNFVNTRVGSDLNTENDNDPNVKTLKLLGSTYKQNVDQAVMARDIPGLESVGDDVVVIFKGYNRATKVSNSIDILTINSDSNGEDLNLKPHLGEAKGTTILGKYVSDRQVKRVAAQAGLHEVKPWKNTKNNANVIRMGIIAAHLKKNNPDLKVDSLKVGSFKTTSESSGLPITPIGYNIGEVMQQVKLLASVKDKGTSLLDMNYGNDTKINELLRDETLTDYRQYTGNNLESYLRLVSLSLLQDVEDKGKTKKEYDRMEKWVHMKKHRDILSGIFSDEGIKETLNLIDANEELKDMMLDALLARQIDIEHNLKDKAKDDYEYQYLGQAIMEMTGLKNEYTSFHNLNFMTQKLAMPGMSGIKMIDEFVGNMQRTIGEMNRDIYQNFFKESREMHDKLIKDMKARGKVLRNQGATIFDDMIEYEEFPVKDRPGETVKRSTGRFLPKNSPTLSKVQREYIEWYNKLIYQSMTEGLTESELERFNEHWEEGFIPVIAPTTDTLFGELFRANSEGAFMDKVGNFFQRSLDPYSSKNDFVENASNNKEVPIDKFEKQKKFSGEVVPGYGDVTRMERLGITADGYAMTHREAPGKHGKPRPITLAVESNLEHVIGVAMMNMYRQRYLKKPLAQFKAVKSAVAMANSARFKENKTIISYLESYVDKNIFQMNQVNEENEQIAKMVQGVKTASNFMMLDYNLTAQAKNTIAGFFHTLSTSIANPKLGKHMPKAFTFVSNPKNWEFVESFMWHYGLANADSDQLVNGIATQRSRRGFANSHFKNLINYHSDYYYRAVFMVANMMKDGTVDTFTKNKNVHGPGWDYDESKDPRFKGPEGKSFKAALKKQLEAEGKVSKEGKLLSPYSSYEIQRMKFEANDAFEAQNEEMQENFRNDVTGMVFGQFRSWWYQKIRRYTQSSGKIESMKQLVTRKVVREVKNPKTGKIEKITDYVTEYEGTYMEGILQTVMGLAGSLRAAYDVKNFSEVKDYYQNMTSYQKQNINRLVGDLGLLASFLMLGAFIFDDEEDKDTFWYYIWFGAVDEVNIASHLRATPILGDGTVAPSISFIHNLMRAPLETLSSPGFMKPIEYFIDEE